MPLYSEFEPKELNMQSINNYYKEQCDRKDSDAFKGTLDQFIKKYGLEVEMWIINSNYNLKGIDRIVFEIL